METAGNMQPLTENAINVPAFLNKLWKMVNDPKTDHLISWGSGGTTFVIQNKAQFWYELLPLYYKHNNMSSFIRQLNMYGFHKIQGLDAGDGDKDELRFLHQFFQKNKPELLRGIKRKVTTSHKVETASESDQSICRDEINKFLADITQLKGRQQTVDSQLGTMKQENAVLWRELALLRQKHMQQQKIVNKLIQFLVTLVQPSSRMGGLGPKRHYPLMINEKPTKKAKTNKSESSKSDASEGPTIHELENTEFLQDEYLTQAAEADATADTTTESYVQSPHFNHDNFVELLSDSEMPDDIAEDLTTTASMAQEEDNLDMDGKIFLNTNTQDTLLSNLMNGNYNSKSMNDVLSAGTSTAPVKKEGELTNPGNKTVATRARLSRLNSVEDMDLHVEKTQNEIESLKDILNPLLSGVQTVDANAFLGLFSDDMAPFGLSYNPDDLPKSDPLLCGSELTKYGSNLDFSQLFDEDSSDDLPISDTPVTDNLDEGGSITTPQIIPDAPSFPKAK